MVYCSLLLLWHKIISNAKLLVPGITMILFNVLCTQVGHFLICHKLYDVEITFNSC